MDGIWITLMQETHQRRTDRLGRQRVVKRAHQVPILVAQGMWPEQNRREVLGWIVASGEDEASWEALLTQLEERGVRPERGLVLLVADGSPGLPPARETVWWDVAFQRCVFHKLRNVWRAIRIPEGLKGKAARAFKRRFIRSAARIWQALTEREARRRLRAFCRKWQERQPEAIATLDRDVEDAVTFYRVQAAAAQRGQSWPAHHLRTTSPLERELHAFRQRMRQAVLWHSRTGLEAQGHADQPPAWRVDDRTGARARPA